jgi:predicted phage baseplate assembly protein
LLDYERLALTVPGSKISRARAWAGLNPFYPCLQAPGTVTVVIVPSLPTGAPQPTSELLELVFRYLNRRRILGTRLVVVGPEYLEVTVQAEVRTRRGADGARVQGQIISSLNAFLDPLTGGPNGRGWPFGRDVYRSEILQVIDNVPGVDHVLSLELIPGDGEAQCANLCVGPAWLVRAGNHQVIVA